MTWHGIHSSGVGDKVGISLRLDLVILEVFFNISDSVELCYGAGGPCHLMTDVSSGDGGAV